MMRKIQKKKEVEENNIFASSIKLNIYFLIFLRDIRVAPLNLIVEECNLI